MNVHRWLVALLVLSLVTSYNSSAQSAFGYVNLPPDASQNALGGETVSLVLPTSFSFFQNPALLDSSQLKLVGAGISPIFGQGVYSAASYVFSRKTDTYWGIGFRGITFGRFTGTDAVGNPTEDFGAGNALLTVAYARRRNLITFGAAAKIVTSFIESYSSTAIFFDAGGTFRHPEKDLTVALTARNFGVVISRFADVQQQLPFDLLAGVTFKPEYMPVRFTFTANQLYRFKSLESELVGQNISNAQQVFGHLSGGAELLFSPKIVPMLGFNYRTNATFKLGEQNRLAGLSYGLRFQHKKLILAASRTNYLPQIGRWVFSGSWEI